MNGYCMALHVLIPRMARTSSDQSFKSVKFIFIFLVSLFLFCHFLSPDVFAISLLPLHPTPSSSCLLSWKSHACSHWLCSNFYQDTPSKLIQMSTTLKMSTPPKCICFKKGKHWLLSREANELEYEREDPVPILGSLLSGWLPFGISVNRLS